jgi:hypothetical protein
LVFISNLLKLDQDEPSREEDLKLMEESGMARDDMSPRLNDRISRDSTGFHRKE